MKRIPARSFVGEGRYLVSATPLLLEKGVEGYNDEGSNNNIAQEHFRKGAGNHSPKDRTNDGKRHIAQHPAIHASASHKSGEARNGPDNGSHFVGT